MVPREWSDIPAPLRRGLLVVAAALGPMVIGCSGFHREPRSVAVDLREMGLPPAERERVLGYRDAPAAAPVPAAPFPAAIALIEVTAWRSGDAGFSPPPDASRMTPVARAAFPDAAQLALLMQLPGVLTARAFDTRALDGHGVTLDDLRAAALRQRADLLLVYTFDAFAESKDRFELGTVLTLGLLPTHRAGANATAHAALVDTRTGYVYGFAEATAEADRLANLYSDRAARQDALERAERRAFGRLIDAFPQAWNRVRMAHP